MGVGDSEQAPSQAAAPPQPEASGGTTTVKSDLQPGSEQRAEQEAKQGRERGGRGCESEDAASPSPRRVLFSSVREALVASESLGRARQSFDETAQLQLDRDDLGGGYVVLRRQRSQSVGVEPARKPAAGASEPAADAAGYTVIRRRAASEASATLAAASARGGSRARGSGARASTHAAMTGSAAGDARRRHSRRNQRAGAAARGGAGDARDRRPGRASQAPQLPLQRAREQRGGWGGATSPLGAMTSLRRALGEAAPLPLPPPPPPGLEGESASASASGPWPPQEAPGTASLWPAAPLALEEDEGAAALGRQLQRQQRAGDEGGGPAWAAAASAGVLASRSVPAWPPPPSSAVELPAEDKTPSERQEQREDDEVSAGWRMRARGEMGGLVYPY